MSDAALRLLQAMVKLAPRNARNSDSVARALRMGKDKTNAARKALRALGHWHARKRRNGNGEVRDQRLASLVPLRTAAEVAAGWAAAEEAARLGKDTDASRRLGVRVLNSAEWYGRSAPRTPVPAAGPPAVRPTRRRPPAGEKKEEELHTPLPVPAPYAERAERVLLQLRRTVPELVLTVAEARELAQVAGEYLLRGESPETVRAVVAHGLPAEGVRCPRAFVRTRLLRYMPPLPEPRGEPVLVPVRAPEPPRAGGPAELFRRGEGWRAAVRAAARPYEVSTRAKDAMSSATRSTPSGGGGGVTVGPHSRRGT
ncbi:hypothetical protein [Streptomyces sp. NPDC048172]|uniref:hypothetical protein n=1 Tax=Streptomyces sp. NPDC048172 TaxID=3365505 RepID=UPI00371CDC3E